MSSPVTAAEIRESFLSYFAAREHQRVPSASLVPLNDPTLLFTNAGMVPFKDVFTGLESRPYKRATSSQKCVRAGGKHNDLDNVGYTARHHTFFEMLGNFSFGDYFKAEAIPFAWTFVVDVLKLDPERLSATVFNGEGGLPWDQEAYDLWVKAGVPESRIHKLGAKDNFWAMGDVGPCGPCSELHYFQGNEVPCAEEAAGRSCLGVACECDRWLEIWNLVFMQFNRAEKDGELRPLPRPSIDTGAGLERLAAVVQGKLSNYDTDLFQSLLASVVELSGRAYDAADPDSASMRVIVDHSRAAAFLIADGVTPSNEGRGYVLRRIMRRAIRHGATKLGMKEPFLHRTVERVIDVMGDAYPELREHRTFVLEATRHEEESFRRTLDRGLKMIDEELAKLEASGGKLLPGDVVFFLHGTHGFPWDLTQVIARERGLDVDLEGYERRMKEEADKNAFAGSGEKSVGAAHHAVRARIGETVFLGYDGEGHDGEGSLRAILRDGVEVREAHAGEEVELIFDRTPFYGESGGQVGDTGRIIAHGGDSVAKVLDAQRPVSGLVVHRAKIEQGRFEVGVTAQLGVDGARRKAIRANHSATHLLHEALKRVLGDHVKQAGSVVAPEQLRFDFNHFGALTHDQLTAIEDLVNAWVRDNTEASTRLMKLDEAKASGAVAMFGEKYGEEVRVVSVHPASIELCGGTHVGRSGDIGLFKIVSESGIASGVRRIVAVTGAGALAHVREEERELLRASALLKAQPRELSARIEAMQKRMKELEKRAEEAVLRASAGGDGGGDLLSQVQEINGVKVIAARVDPADAKVYRTLADQLRDKLQSGIVALGGEKDGKALVLVAATRDMPAKGLRAGDLVREMAEQIGGRGGGKPDLAQAGGTEPGKLPAAFDRLLALVRDAKA
jgi:alanyl-tRNA synthetase